jgi:hypothetical protein
MTAAISTNCVFIVDSMEMFRSKQNEGIQQWWNYWFQRTFCLSNGSTWIIYTFWKQQGNNLIMITIRPWKDHFKSDLRSDQDHLLKKDLRSDQDHIFLKNDLDLKIKIKDHFLTQMSPFWGSKFQNGQKVDFELLKLPSALLRRELLQYKVNTIMIKSLNIILLTAAELPKREK